METRHFNLSLNRWMALAAAASFVVGGAPGLRAQTDDFSDGNDTENPAWARNSAYVGSSGQTWAVENGAYRLQAPNNSPFYAGFGYVGSLVGSPYTDVSVSADFVNFLAPMGGAFGVGARLTSNNTLGSLSGYGYAYEPFADSLKGEMVLYRIDGLGGLHDIGSYKITLDPAKDYRFVLEIAGSNLHGQVFEVGGGMVAEQFGVDATYASGVSGVFGYSQSPVPPTDFSVDNFAAMVVPEPALSVLLGLGGSALWVARRFRSNRG
ncbi:MAG: PEP-CTERM sorting domain-containing protein [Verrucomicrobia bacterium]|nr:PEP-CTERM sorting domain-containing protein [Verrucomicrobiota bacterium]